MADLDRNELEQRALRELSRNQLDRATQTYTQILRLEPRDRRIRQKLAELYLKGGRQRDAERQYRQLYKAYRHDGNHRALVAVLLKLRQLAPDDFEMRGRLGESYRNLGRASEAKPLLEESWRALMRQDIEMALSFADMRLGLDPSDIPFLTEIAEGLVSLNMNIRAFGYYERGIRLYRDRGQLEEMGRLAVRALELKPDEPDLLRAAAEASLSVDDVATALQHLQPAFATNPNDPVVLDLMARCFEHAGDGPKARRVLLELARVQEAAQEPAGWLNALERAQKAGEPGLESRLDKAQAALALAELRLHQLPSAQPSGESSGRPCVQASVFVRYGFVDRAAASLDAARQELPDDLALLAWRAEVAVEMDDLPMAIRLGKIYLSSVGGEEAEKVAQRLRSLGADIQAPGAGSDPSLDDEDELIDDPPTDTGATEPSFSDDLDPFAAGPDPFADDLDPFAQAIKSRGSFEVDAPSIDEDPFAGLDLDDDEDEPGDRTADALEEARGLIGMAEFSEALKVLEGLGGLEVATLRARCQRELGQTAQALLGLRDILDEAEDSEPGWMEAQFELADLAGRAQKPKLALRTLKRVHDKDPTWRAKDVAARVRLLRKRLQK